MKAKAFLHTIDNERIVAAIRAAEARSRGEIRVHVARRKVDDAQAEAVKTFEKLGMAATAERTGVLFFVAPESQRFAVIGDKGVNEKCGDAFWREVADAAAAAFREGRFSDGIVAAVGRLGDLLAEHFPPRAGQADKDELSNDVTEDT